jgi:hypothetical protein
MKKLRCVVGLHRWDFKFAPPYYCLDCKKTQYHKKISILLGKIIYGLARLAKENRAEAAATLFWIIFSIFGLAYFAWIAFRDLVLR